LEVSIGSEVASPFAYEPFTLRLEAVEAADIPEIPSGASYTVTSVEPEADSGSFIIEIIPEEAGILTLPPITVRAGDETAKTAPLRIMIHTPRRADEMDLSFAFSATNLMVDQPVEMTVTWTSEVPFTRCNELQFTMPLLLNSAWEVYPREPDVPEEKRIGLPINTQRLIASNEKTEAGYELSVRYWLVPRREGVYRTEAGINCVLLESENTNPYPSYFNNHFFSHPSSRDRFERVYLTAPLPQLTVLALPETGRTTRYSGIVGACTPVASIEPADTVVGQPMLLTITLNDIAFGGHIQNLPDETLGGLGPEFQITRKPIHTVTLDNAKAFTYIVRPLRSGIDTLPALAIDLFDPEQKTYRTVRTEPLTITINPDGNQTVYQPAAGQNQPPLVPLSGIRNNWKESELHMNTYRTIELFARTWWLFWLLPPLFWLALRPWLRRRDRCRNDPDYARATRAARRFSRTASRDEETAWKTYLADRLGLHAEAVTFESVEEKLQQQNISPELIESVRARFAKEDTTLYAPPNTPLNDAPPARTLVQKLEKATKLLLLTACLLPAFDTRAETPEALFEQAKELRMEKPDEAQPLFTEAALGFEAEKQFINAGNSWFFADKNGRALANFRAAESRAPFNKQVRESIGFIRTQREDSFQDSEKTNFIFSRVWKRLCLYHPALRIGLLTGMYLIAWAAFLATRIAGKRIPRKVWIVYGAHAAIITLTLIWSAFQPSEGVVIQTAEARLGPGYAYAAAYETVLHEATEFQWLEENDGWVHVRLPDNTQAWLRKPACQKVR
jgi:hypothetical protein